MQRFSNVLVTPLSSIPQTGPESKSHPWPKHAIMAFAAPSRTGVGAELVVNNNEPENNTQCKDY